jgi:hypothetical protein
MHKLIHDSRLANLTNFMCAPLTGKTFLGLAQLSPDRNWGLVMEGRYFCAVHAFNKMMKSAVADDSDKEEAQLKDKLFYAVLLKGNDNSSYVKRFATKEEMVDWYRDIPFVNPNKDKSLLSYNS